MSNDFYTSKILPYGAIISKLCRAYTNSEEDFEDYYQEVCFQIWKSRDRFQGKAKWSTWVYRVALNVCMTLLKKSKGDIHRFVSDPVEAGETMSNQAFANESLNLLYVAIHQLSEVDRAIILLYLEEKTYQEIAEIMGTNSNHVGVKINRIKERLKKILDEKDN